MIWDFLNEKLAEAFAAAGHPGVPAVAERSRRPEAGQFQCNTAMTRAKAAKQPPVAIANAVAERLGHPFAQVSVAGPGFINFSLADDFLAAETGALLDDPRHRFPAVTPQRIMMDFGGPNVAKRMHVGHLRSSIIGDSLQRVSRFLGHDVISDVHLGDWGLPMGMLIAEIRRRRPELPYFAPGGPDGPVDDGITVDLLNQLYPEAAARCKADAEALEEAKQATTALQTGDPGHRALWRRMVDVSVDAVRADEGLLGVHFDLWEGESDVRDRLDAMVERLAKTGVAERSAGALVVPVARDDDAEPVPPLMLVKGDGSVTYGTTDVATIEHRVETYDPDTVWYVVDARQRLHFVQVFRTAERAGMIAAGRPVLEHLGFGTMNGPDGRPFKTRAGEVMSLRALLEMTIDEARARIGELTLAADLTGEERESIARRIGLAAIKFADLRNHRASDYVFDLAQFSSFEGKTGPYLCYSVVRARSIFARARAAGVEAGPLVPPTTAEERDVSLRLLDFGRAVLATWERRAPNVLCEHAFELAQAFNAFYHTQHILSEEDPARRASLLTLTRIVHDQLVLALGMLGIEAPERM
jgi:arginyl-tRNA synthetase